MCESLSFSFTRNQDRLTNRPSAPEESTSLTELCIKSESLKITGWHIKNIHYGSVFITHSAYLCCFNRLSDKTIHKNISRDLWGTKMYWHIGFFFYSHTQSIWVVLFKYYLLCAFIYFIFYLCLWDLSARREKHLLLFSCSPQGEICSEPNQARLPAEQSGQLPQGTRPPGA